MIIVLLAASIASQPLAADVGYDQLATGHNDAAITQLEDRSANAADPARLINLGIAYARTGDAAKARVLFERAYQARDWVELETATGSWVDSRTLARQALAMLDSGQFARMSQIAQR